MSNPILTQAKLARQTAARLAMLSTDKKNQALKAMGEAIRENEKNILQANAQDIQAAQKKDLPSAFLDRLQLNSQRILSMIKSLEIIAELPDPVGRTLATIKRPNGLEITRTSVPLGVIGVIYESRPNVTVDAAALSIKSGNAVILRGGSVAFHSNSAIFNALQLGLTKANLPPASIQMLASTDRSALCELLHLDQYIDVIIPRGGPTLIDFVSKESRIPVFKHLAGLCHTYIHTDAKIEMAKNIIVNAKMRRPGICGATEVLLIDRAIVKSHLPALLEELIQAGCEIRAEKEVVVLDPRVKLSQTSDYDTEFLDAIIAVKVVNSLEEAIAHIAQHGTQHTDAIITENKAAAEKFLQAVDSAIVMHNTSTQFADGGEFGMGAEIGIATGKLHARGPVGLEQLTTFKYVVRGTGQTRPK